MSDFDLPIFPTRTGEAQGAATERKMLEKVGASSIRTETRNNPDGSQTMLRTRNGHPEFTTTKKPAATVSTDLVETAYLLRTLVTPDVDAGYISGLAIMQQTPLDGNKRLDVPAYPDPAATTSSYSVGLNTSFEGVEQSWFPKALTGTIVDLTTGVSSTLSPTTVTDFFGSYTTCYPLTDAWTVVRANRVRTIPGTVAGKAVHVTMKSPADEIDHKGVAPFDAVLRFGRPWHGEFTADGLKTSAGVLRTDAPGVLKAGRGDHTLVCFDDGIAVEPGTDKETAEGIQWANYLLLQGQDKKILGGTADSKTIGPTGWIFKDQFGVVWNMSFDTSAIPNYPTQTPFTYTLAVTAKKASASAAEAPVQVGDIQVSIAYTTNRMPTELPSLGPIEGTAPFHIVNQSPKGDRAAITLRVGYSGDPLYPPYASGLVEAVVYGNEDAPPSVVLTTVVARSDCAVANKETVINVPTQDDAPIMGCIGFRRLYYSSDPLVYWYSYLKKDGQPPPPYALPDGDYWHTTVYEGTSGQVIFVEYERFSEWLIVGVYDKDGALHPVWYRETRKSHYDYDEGTPFPIGFLGAVDWNDNLYVRDYTNVLVQRESKLIRIGEKQVELCYWNSDYKKTGTRGLPNSSGNPSSTVISGWPSTTESAAKAGVVITSNCSVVGFVRVGDYATESKFKGVAVVTPYRVFDIDMTYDSVATGYCNFWSICVNPVIPSLQYSDSRSTWYGFV